MRYSAYKNSVTKPPFIHRKRNKHVCTATVRKILKWLLLHLCQKGKDKNEHPRLHLCHFASFKRFESYFFQTGSFF